MTPEEPTIEDSIRSVIQENEKNLKDMGMPVSDFYRLAINQLILGHMPDITPRDKILKEIQEASIKCIEARIKICTLAKKLEELDAGA